MKGFDAELWKRDRPLLQTDFLVRERIPGLLPNVEGAQILDAGCGEGYVSRKLAKLGASVSGFDIDPEMIALAQEMERDNHLGIAYATGDLLSARAMYSRDHFDAAVVSGVVCFLDEAQLCDGLEQLAAVMKPGGALLVATNHLDSYLQRARSNWLEYTSEPERDNGTQVISLTFRNPDRQAVFDGSCYMHSPAQIERSMMRAGFGSIALHSPLATEEDRKAFPHMWGDESTIPYHLIAVGTRK